jgi:hypothetical protein
MSKVNMSVHRGLSELKLYSNKIESANRGAFVVANKQSNKNIGGRSVEDVTNSIKGNFDSMVALIENRKIIKDAVVKSNANTNVVVGGKEMTVAEAIERKASVEFERMFLQNLQNQFVQQNNVVEQQNDQLQTKLESFLQATLGEKRDLEMVKQLTKTFEDSNKYALIDPCHIQNYIEKLSKEIEEFLSQVDYVLSESNATTFFDVELVD